MMNSRRRPVAIDLFAGAGGFSLGIEQAGFDVAVAVEHDPIHAAVYAFNFPHTKVLCTDVATLSGQSIREAVEGWAIENGQLIGNKGYCLSAISIDLVFGGPPCQGFSVMGKRQLDDVRNTLVFEFCRIVKELQPRYFVMENVPGLCLPKYSHILERLMSEFEAAGYKITEPVQVLNAANFGVPQQRRRLFVLGTRTGLNKLAYPEPNVAKLGRQSACVQSGGRSANRKRSGKRKSKGKDLPCQYVTVRDAIADLPNLDDFPELHKTDCIQLTPEQFYQMHEKATLYVQKLRDLTGDGSNFAYFRRWNPQLLTNSIQTQHTETTVERFRETPPGKIDTISRLRRLDWNKPCHTLRAGTGSDRGAHTSPRPIHPEYPRVISVREAARLHSFPDWFRLHITKWHGFREVGNAVPPFLARALGSQIIAALEVQPSVPQGTLELGNPQLLQLQQLSASQYWQLQIE
jgi:DNA (cytosine-5)-methyltransferase 1